MTDTPPPEGKKLAPWFVPDIRAWVAFGLWLLTALIFVMIYFKPDLTTNQGFMFLSQAVIVSGLIGGPVAFLFIASKAAAEIRQQGADQLDKAMNRIPTTGDGSATLTIQPPADVTVTTADPKV